VRLACLEEEQKNGDYPAPMNEAKTIFESIKKGETDFWEGVYRPFSEKSITRQMVKEVIHMGKEEYGNGIPNLARKLRACQADNGTEREEDLKFQKFKNFIYKTVKITSI